MAKANNGFDGDLCSAKVVEMTRDRVNAMLIGNEGNRRVNKSNLKKLTDEFRGGRYRFTGQPIILDEFGVLRDGQHRLMALRDAGYPNVKMLVVTLKGDRSNIEEAYDKMDTGVIRRYATLLEHKGVENAKFVASLCKKIAYFKDSFGKFDVLPDSYYEDVRKMYSEEISKTTPLMKNRGFIGDMAAAVCIVGRVTGCIDECLEICRRAIDNDMLQRGTAEHTLNRVFTDMSHVDKRGKGHNANAFTVVANALIAALNNRKYPCVDRNTKKAIKWVMDMSSSNDVFVLPPRGSSPMAGETGKIAV
ncbi:MAG: hypothetical protein MJZ81_11415 [Bacteroidales bacterium]|nr:hypothetical protein [Bacteroidales bacterium]